MAKLREKAEQRVKNKLKRENPVPLDPMHTSVWLKMIYLTITPVCCWWDGDDGITVMFMRDAQDGGWESEICLYSHEGRSLNRSGGTFLSWVA